MSAEDFDTAAAIGELREKVEALEERVSELIGHIEALESLLSERLKGTAN